ncbi:hypothetical protein EPIR_3147 [Erwinia piriflorinigrans CFBP 5888]|uniref:Uncharacterized protein n=1 Tax=Erwinia piriflorinigrans CFBP 5888 TaxID=1161919 RepID=V5ZB96_9GAMM|nr:hypothetical protein EPIR_3147 [Erwinia piriflorinigrans CFBP 5888]
MYLILPFFIQNKLLIYNSFLLPFLWRRNYGFISEVSFFIRKSKSTRDNIAAPE